MDNTIKRILEETGSSNVSDVVFNESKQKWVVAYNSDLPNDEFEYFDDVLMFLNTETI